MTTILLAGVAVLDFVFHMENFPREPEKYRAHSADIVGGGNAANAAVAISRLGGTSKLASRVGDDQIADMIEAGLEREGVDCALLKRFKKHRSSFSSIYLDAQGERQIMNYRDHELTMNAKWLSRAIPDDIDACLADTRWPDGAYAAMKAAKKRGIPGVIDAEAPVWEAEKALFEASHVAFSAQGAVDFTESNDLEAATIEAAQRLPGKVYVTHGENGVYSYSNGRVILHPAFPVRPVNTLGAGDVWHGAFTLALAEHLNDTAAIGFANAAAALKCQRRGGLEATPTREEVETFLEAMS